LEIPSGRATDEFSIRLFKPHLMLLGQTKKLMFAVNRMLPLMCSERTFD